MISTDGTDTAYLFGRNTFISRMEFIVHIKSLELSTMVSVHKWTQQRAEGQAVPLPTCCGSRLVILSDVLSCANDGQYMPNFFENKMGESSRQN